MKRRTDHRWSRHQTELRHAARQPAPPRRPDGDLQFDPDETPPSDLSRVTDTHSLTHTVPPVPAVPATGEWRAASGIWGEYLASRQAAAT
jgi:hypothetical protein